MSKPYQHLELNLIDAIDHDKFVVRTNLPGTYFVVNRNTLGTFHSQIDLKFNDLHDRENKSKKVSKTLDID